MAQFGADAEPGAVQQSLSLKPLTLLQGLSIFSFG
jgi:hypothetical protein